MKSKLSLKSSKPQFAYREIRGKQIRIKELTSWRNSAGMNVELDNGVSVWISFNQNEIHMSFSGIDYDEMISIREAELIGIPLKLSNNLTIKYKPHGE